MPNEKEETTDDPQTRLDAIQDQWLDVQEGGFTVTLRVLQKEEGTYTEDQLQIALAVIAAQSNFSGQIELGDSVTEAIGHMMIAKMAGTPKPGPAGAFGGPKKA